MEICGTGNKYDIRLENKINNLAQSSIVLTLRFLRNLPFYMKMLNDFEEGREIILIFFF